MRIAYWMHRLGDAQAICLLRPLPGELLLALWYFAIELAFLDIP